jgi:hypothetical protein
MSRTVKVIDNISQTVLFECDITEIDRAYAHATKYEEMGLDINVVAPSLPETLATSLGQSPEQIAKLTKEMDEEIEDHNLGNLTGCAVCLPENKTVH